MPIIIAHLPKSLVANREDVLLKNLSAAIRQALDIPEENVRIILQLSSEKKVLMAGKLDVPYSLYIVYMLRGRDANMKKGVADHLTIATKSIMEISAENIRIIIRDVDKEDMLVTK